MNYGQKRGAPMKFRFSVTTISLLMIFASQACAQLAKPQIISPVGASPMFPDFIWIEVPGATQYKVEVHTVHQIGCTPDQVTFAGPDIGLATVDARPRCSHGKCGFPTKPGQGIPEGFRS